MVDIPGQVQLLNNSRLKPFIDETKARSLNLLARPYYDVPNMIVERYVSYDHLSNHKPHVPKKIKK